MKKLLYDALGNIAIAGIFIMAGLASANPVQTEIVHLSGKGPSDAVEWDFHCSSGRMSGEWTKILVPSNWEQHGFGGYDYGHNPPAEKHDETGTYRTTFMVPLEWKDRHVRLVFEGSMTETSIKMNGQPVGTPNLGGYLPFRFPLDGNTFRDGEVEPVLKYGEMNELEVRVAKKPSNRSLDIAERKGDYWVFGGIYRPVWLEVSPKEFIDRVAIDARMDGTFVMEAFVQEYYNTPSKELKGAPLVDYVEAQILTMEGESVGASFATAIPGPVASVRLESRFKDVEQWNPESPRLYQVRTRLMKGGETVHERFDTFGFRTIELHQGDGLYLNGVKLRIKGINRNGMHPETARAINPTEAWEDARLIKAMNANLVRSHMPPTSSFMEACDRLGLLVITELCNWQEPAMDTPVARNLAFELVAKYHNHPSYIMWANGNEGGFNKEVDQLYHFYDLQRRPVIHPWSVFGGLDTLHYPDYEQLQDALKRPFVVLNTEFLHGLYDGGHGAGLADYWELMCGSPNSAGGVLWCWADAAVARTDMGGMLDTAGNYSADGIVGPYREREASYYTVREIWSPVRISLDAIALDFDGTLPLENHYTFRTLADCSLQWELVRFPGPSDPETGSIVTLRGVLRPPPIAPGASGAIRLPLPDDWDRNDALIVQAIDARGVEVMKWSWPLRADVTVPGGSDGQSVRTTGDGLFEAAGVVWAFDVKTGHLLNCSVEGKNAGLGFGPVLYMGTSSGPVKSHGDWKSQTRIAGNNVVITSSDAVTGDSFSWKLFPDGRAELDYVFTPVDTPLTYCAVGFKLPEAGVVSKRWLGDGPFRIWANRRQGPVFGLWENAYNDTVPGVNWDYPAFKGVFGNVDWMRLDLTSGASLLADPLGLADVGVLRPANEPDVRRENGGSGGPRTATWEYPESGGLFLFHKVPAVGTKFKKSEELGPQSRPQRLEDPVAGKLVLHLNGN
jgi:hypothetical protein